MTNEVLNTMKTRRSCRCYLDKMPEPEALNAVLEAGTYAASAMGRQSAKIVVVQDAETRAQLTRMNAAAAIGLGSCWINRAKETFETPDGKALLAKWGLDPEKYIGVGYCILGYPAPNGTRTPGPRKAGYVLHV